MLAQTASSRQRNLVPATETSRTVGGRGWHRRSQASRPFQRTGLNGYDGSF
jgi:hypothetical protein